MRRFQAISPQAVAQLPTNPISKFLFSDTRMSWFWLIMRCYVGYQWLVAGLGKLTGHSFDIGSFGASQKGGPWVFTAHTGAALKGFASNALTLAHGAHPSVSGWYATFLQHMVMPQVGVFTYMVTFGEILVGLGLIFGAFTGIAAFFGIFMNMNYLLAGSISVNPILATLALFLLLAWRVSGFYGLDRYLLPLLGTPWTRSRALPRRTGNVSVDLSGALDSSVKEEALPLSPVK